MNQEKPVDRADVIDYVLRVIKIPLALASKPMREKAIEYCEENNITAQELIDYSYKKLMSI